MKKIGRQTYSLDIPCYIYSSSALVGEKEKNGIFGNYFKNDVSDDKLGESSFEKGERKMLEKIVEKTLCKSKIKKEDIDLYLGGDLMNQIITSNYVARNIQIPFVGIYSACSTITEALALAGCLIDAGGVCNVLCSAISHFSSAERQYRYPLEFGNQRQSYSQWTVTAGGAFVVSTTKSVIRIKSILFGKVIDYGVVDIANMGAAMAPAIAGSLSTYFEDTKTTPDDFDLIASGDLGKFGSDLLRDLMSERGYELGQVYSDFGHSIFAYDEELYQGGSGAGCCASILATYVCDKIKDGTFKRVLICATGALMSTTINQQGDSIPSISHIIELVRED